MASIYYRDQDVWIEATEVYKKVNGAWVKQSDLTAVLENNTRYINKNVLSYLIEENQDRITFGGDRILV